MPYCKDIAQQTLRWCSDGDCFMTFFVSCVFSEPRAARFRPAYLIHTKATPCVEVRQTSNLQWLRLGEEKKKEETTGQTYNCLPYSIGQP